MQSRLVYVITFLLLTFVITALTYVVHTYENYVEGRVSTEEVLLVSNVLGKPIGAYPSDLHIKYMYSYTYIINETGEVKLEVIKKRWEWLYPYDLPTQTYIPEINAELKLTYNVIFKVSAEGVVKKAKNETYTRAGVAIHFDIEIYLEFIKPPNTTGSVDIGNLIFRYAFNNITPSIYYEVEVKKYVNNVFTEDILISETFSLSFSNLLINFYTVMLDVKNITRTAYISLNNLSTVPTVLKPIYNASICGNVIGSNTTIQLVVSIGFNEAVLTVSGGEESCCVISGIELIPKANSTIPVAIRAGAFALLLNLNKSVEGAVLSLGSPLGNAIGSGNRWDFTVVLPITVSGFYATGWGVFTISGTVITPYGEVPCKTLSISGEGAYVLTCNKTLITAKSLTAEEVLANNYFINISVVDDLGGEHKFTGFVSMTAVDPTQIADIAWRTYSTAINVIFAGIIFVLALMIISILKESITGIPLLDVLYLRSVLVTLLVAIILLYVALPVAYKAFTDALTSIPIFREYIEPIPSYDPKTVFTNLIKYYEKLFEAIERDYQVRFIGSVQKIMDVLSGFIVSALIVFGVALGLSWLFGAGIPFASIGGALLSLVFTYLGLLIMVAPGGAVVLAGVAIGRVVILMTTIVIIAVMTLGVFMLCIPSPLSQMFGEMFFGSGILYFIAFPLIAPITYSLYMHVVETAGRAVAQSVSVALGPFQLVIPIGAVAEIMIYFIASGASILIIITTLAYILSRTGIATGIGEALSGLVWRG